ncbi:MAG: hypothetical protein PHH77_07600 [Victivallaceae bacterium]|nr:hypothetical protein [Victivallaceae bacterium]
MTESKAKLIEMREELLNAVANVQMKLKSLDNPTAKLCTACDSGCTACNSTCSACQSTKTV